MKRKADEPQSEPPTKKPNTSLGSESCFRSDLFSPETQSGFAKAYNSSTPYSHAVVPSLIQEKLLRSVRDEITEHVHFTLKETDIYRIHQSGDLANLSKLATEDLKHLPSLVTLRDALYSNEFRAWISNVTGAGKVSGTKTDMAVNVYTPGSYLLCHDDVIGSRRVSYILYLTDPDEPWQPEWGGGLRLYPTEVRTNGKGEEVKVPLAEHTLNIPPSFGQLSFFAVRPGESYHDVEEVYHGKDGKRIRMAISGWYHIPQVGEDGYEEGVEETLVQKSSLAQLKGATDEFDEPANQFVNFQAISTDEQDILTEQDLTFLVNYITPSYLTPEMTENLAATFIEDSVIQLEGFLKPVFAEKIEEHVKAAENASWNIARPPHKHRFQYKQLPTPESSSLDNLLAKFLPSGAFRKWLGLITGLAPNALIKQNLVARHFRRGKDYALASSYHGEEPRLEYTIGLTPNVGEAIVKELPGNGNSGANGAKNPHVDNDDINVNVSDEEDHGGQEVYMAGDEEYDSTSTALPQVGKKAAHDPAVYRTRAQEEDDDDAILFTDNPSWNTLSIVMRDQGTLRFVKYVSEAGQDRWDIKGEVEIDHELDRLNENENRDEQAEAEDQRLVSQMVRGDEDEDFSGDNNEDVNQYSSSSDD